MKYDEVARKQREIVRVYVVRCSSGVTGQGGVGLRTSDRSPTHAS